MSKYIYILTIVLFATIKTFGQQTNTDSLSVNPLQPTTLDSVTLTILIPNTDCCIRSYVYDSVAVLASDTAIQLSYQLAVCACPQNICNPVLFYRGLCFKSAPLRAGTYTVYENLRLLMIASYNHKIGSFTVVQPTSVKYRPSREQKVVVQRAETITKYYTVQGKLINHQDIRGHSGRVMVIVNKEGSASLFVNR